ncbi:hypothetical protein L195_g058272, partial [Trifolium pratense]
DGCVVAASCWYLPVLPQSDVAKGLARLTLLKGMEFAKDLLSRKLTVESDSSNVINAINESQYQQSYLGAIVEDCRGSQSSKSSCPLPS